MNWPIAFAVASSVGLPLGSVGAEPTAPGGAMAAPAIAPPISPVESSWATICAPGASLTPVIIRVQLDASGHLVGAPQSSEKDTTNPAAKAASDLAISAVLKAAPTYVGMTSLHGKSFSVTFNPKPHCAAMR